MLELYHSINSVCAQKVRIALAEKGLPYEEHLMTLGGDQFDPAYMKLNPNAVVPTLIHDGQPLIESSVILYYLDEAFPERPLMPAPPLARARVRLFNKLIDEYVHNSCTILTFATAFRPGLLKLSPEEREAGLAKAPSKQRSAYKRDVVAQGLDSPFTRCGRASREAADMDRGCRQRPPILGGRSLLARRRRGHTVHAAAGTASALRDVGQASRRHGLVEACPAQAVNRGGDLPTHDRGGLRTLHEPSARPVA
jgi:glutathione S-transferase